MIYYDPTFESLATAPIKTTNVEVAIQTQDPYGYYDGAVKWTSSDLLMSVSIDSVGQFLGAVTKKATVKLLGIVDTAVAGDLFQIRLGLYDSDPGVLGFNDISEGFYIVDNIAYDYEAGSTTVTMYDHMWTASQTPYPQLLTYPCTVAELAGQISAILGTELMVGFSSLPNASYTIAADPYESIANATLQTVIQEIAATTGTTARISDTTLVFSQFAVSSDNLTSNELKTLKVGKTYGPVTSVVLGRVPQNDNIVLTNTNSTVTTISNIDDGTNLFTIVDNGMPDGTLVRVESTGTLPAPLSVGTNYFVYTNSSTDTFALAPTYADAIAGTNLIDLTTVGSGTISLSELSTQEVQINNIEILDDDRPTLLPPIYAALVGLGWSEVRADTVGLGWYEVGDVVQFTQGSTTVHGFLSEVHLTLAGSVKENIVSVIPNAETINYQTAGGVLKSVWNTEIKVDKQENDITSIVSQQLEFENETLADFTEVYQTIDGVTTQIQSSGGGNFILNSVGRAQDADGSLVTWTQSGTGAVTSYSSAGSLASGGVSGYAIELSGDSVQILQNIQVATTSAYSIGFRVNKLLGDGSARISLQNDVTNFYVDVEAGTEYTWDELKIENVIPGQNFWNVIVAVTDTTTKIEITDLRVLLGETLTPWVQSHNEILNTQVSLTTDGIRVTSSSNPGDYTVMTPIEFKGYSNVSGSSQPVFWLNRDTTRTEKLSVAQLVDFGASVDGTGGVIRTIVIPDGDRAGIAFVGGA